MTRADRGIEKILALTTSPARGLASNRRVDADSTARSPTVLLGGQGGNPDGSRHQGEQDPVRAAARRRVSHQREHRVPTGYGITYNPLPFSRPLRGFYPLTLASAVQPDRPVRVGDHASSRAFPTSSAPDLSSGRLPLPTDYLMRTPADDVSRSRIHSWNVSYERRLPYDIAVDVAYVGTAKNGGFTDIDINASDVPGGGADSRPLYHRIRGNQSLLLWGPFTKSRYHSLQVAINRPFKNGLMLKGAYTLSKAKNEADDDGWAS